MANQGQGSFQLRVAFSARRSWADEEEDLRRLETLEGDLWTSKNGKLVRVTKEELIEKHHKIHTESVYQAWASGKDADLAERILQPLYYVNRVFGEAMEAFDKKADKIAEDMRKNVYRVCKVDDRQCFASYKVHEKAMMSFCAEFQKICNTSMKMRMFPREDPAPVMENLANLSKWELLHRFKGLCANPKRSKEARRLRDACHDAAHEFYATTAGALMLAEQHVVRTHRALIEYKIDFDQRNPDVAALMKDV
eukprot:jgi/Tetstr1/447317/TSEL_034754.t1